MAPSLQERFGLKKKKNFDAFDDNSYMSEEVADLHAAAPGSTELYVSSLEPTEEEREEDKEQAPSESQTPSGERGPTVLGRLLGKNGSSFPRKSSKNSFQSASSKYLKNAQSNQSADTAGLDTPPCHSINVVAEDAPQTPAKSRRMSLKKPKRRSVACKQSLLKGADCESDESLSDDDGYRPSKGMEALKPNRPKDSELESSLSGDIGKVDYEYDNFGAPGLHDESHDNEDSQNGKEGDHKGRPKLLAAPSGESLMDTGRPKLLAKPSGESLMDMQRALASQSQNEPKPSETKVRSKRRSRRIANEPQGAQFMPSLMSADADAECETEGSTEVDDVGYQPTPMASSSQRRPSLLSAPSRSGDYYDGESTEEDNSCEPSLPEAQTYSRRPSLLSAPSQSGDLVDDGDNSSLPSLPPLPNLSFPSPHEEKFDPKEAKVVPVKFKRSSERRPKESQPASDPKCEVIESKSVPPSKSIAGYWNVAKPVGNDKNPVMNSPAKSKRSSGRKPKEPQPASDPECEGDGCSDEDDDGYLPTAMKSNRPALLSAPSQSSLEGEIFDNEDQNEPNPLAAQSQASLNCSLSDLGPDGTNNGEGSAVFSLSALEKDKNYSNPAKSVLKKEGDDSMAKLDSSLQGLTMAFEGGDGSQSNLYLANVRKNRVRGPGEVDPSLRSTRSNLSFSVNVDPNGETQSINVDTRLPTIESPSKKSRGRNIRGDTEIADMSDIDAPSFATKFAENSSKLSQRSHIASPRKQPRELPQIDLSEQESPTRSPPRRQDLEQEHHCPKAPKTSLRPSKSHALHRRTKSSLPKEDVLKTGPSEKPSMSKSLHRPRSKSPRRKMMRPKDESRVDTSEQEGTGDVSPTSVGGLSPPRRRQRKVTPTTTPKAATYSITPATTPKAASSSTTPTTTPKATSSSNLFKATTPNPRSTTRHSSTSTTPRRAQTPRGTSSKNVVKNSDSFKKFLHQSSGSMRDLCPLNEDQETISKDVVSESLQKVKSTRNLNRSSENHGKTNSLKNLIAESPRTTSSRNLVTDSSRKKGSSSVNPESSRKTSSSSVNPESSRKSSSRSVNPESMRRTGSSRSVNPESPRRTSSSRKLNTESPRRTSSSTNLNSESPRRTTSSRNFRAESPRRASGSRNANTASLQKTGSWRNMDTASPTKAGRDLLKRAQSSSKMSTSDWNYEPNRRHVTPASEDDADNRDRDTNKVSVRHLQQIPSIDIC